MSLAPPLLLVVAFLVLAELTELNCSFAEVGDPVNVIGERFCLFCCDCLRPLHLDLFSLCRAAPDAPLVIELLNVLAMLLPAYIVVQRKVKSTQAERGVLLIARAGTLT